MENGQKHDSIALSSQLCGELLDDGLLSLDHLQKHMQEYILILSREDKQNIIDALYVITSILPVWSK